mgnify:CR=1 FL=1
MNNTKGLLPKEERAEIFKKAGVDLSKDIVVSCNSGITASVVYASLKDIATGKVSLYDGSWTEFSRHK